jgi:predicted nucleic acid-binding protein
MKGIADTGFLVAFANRNDRHHDWATKLAEDVSQPWMCRTFAFTGATVAK